MNIQRSKGFVWLASLAVGGYLAYFVSDFLRRRETLAYPLSAETQVLRDQKIASVLDSGKRPEEQKTDVVDLGSIKKVFFDLDWTGKPIPKAPAATEDPTPAQAPVIPVESLLKVMVVQVDTVDPKKSLAWVTFVDGKLQVHTAKEDKILRPEERLFAPYQDVRVEEITAEGVVFAFDDAARERETVPTSPYASTRGLLGIVMVGPGGAILPDLQKRIVERADFEPFRPEQTREVRKNEFLIGTQTIADLDRDYSRILSRDVRYSTYKNPRTGTTEGIKINYVAPDSLPAQHGLSEGEVLKSINGHRVTSVNDAVAYVKANVNTTDTWIAVFERQGREFTRTYHSPEE